MAGAAANALTESLRWSRNRHTFGAGQLPLHNAAVHFFYSTPEKLAAWHPHSLLQARTRREPASYLYLGLIKDLCDFIFGLNQPV